ncbi:MAG: hypothetical protein ACFFD1_00270 [Candidatus Thorarchaeota archaeon]
MSHLKISEEDHEQISEGPVKIYIPKKKVKNINNKNGGLVSIPKKSDSVFYNPKQAFNREISLLLLQSQINLSGPIDSLIEPFCASGIRAIRYYKQISKINKIVINDLNNQAVELTKYNFVYNFSRVPPNAIFYNKDVRKILINYFQNDEVFSVIDIDPFGSPHNFIHDSVRVLHNPGLLLVTATDMPVWVGKYPEKAYKIYKIPNLFFKNRSYCHEIALRLFISYLQRECLEQNQNGVPLFSLSIDHYLRVGLLKNRGNVQPILDQTGFIIECPNCNIRDYCSLKNLKKYQKKCTCVNINYEMIGPLWLGSLHDQTTLLEMSKILENASSADFVTKRRLEKILISMIDENSINIPWYYDLDWISRKLKCSMPSREKVIQKINDRGFQATKTHFSGKGIKTNAQLNDLAIMFQKKTEC